MDISMMRFALLIEVISHYVMYYKVTVCCATNFAYDWRAWIQLGETLLSWR